MSNSLDNFIYKIKKTGEQIKQTDKLLKDISMDLKKETQLNFKNKRSPDGSGWKKNGSGRQTLSKTGILKNSITTYSTNKVAMIGTNIPYAKIHQFGGVIKAKRSKYLAIPINKKSQNSSPREFDDTFCIPAKNGLFIVRKVGKKGNRLEFLFKLQKEVIIPKRQFMGINNKMKNRYIKMTKEYILK